MSGHINRRITNAAMAQIPITFNDSDQPQMVEISGEVIFDEEKVKSIKRINLLEVDGFRDVEGEDWVIQLGGGNRLRLKRGVLLDERNQLNIEFVGLGAAPGDVAVAFTEEATAEIEEQEDVVVDDSQQFAIESTTPPSPGLAAPGVAAPGQNSETTTPEDDKPSPGIQDKPGVAPRTADLTFAVGDVVAPASPGDIISPRLGTAFDGTQLNDRGVRNDGRVNKAPLVITEASPTTDFSVAATTITEAQLATEVPSLKQADLDRIDDNEVIYRLEAVIPNTSSAGIMYLTKNSGLAIYDADDGLLSDPGFVKLGKDEYLGQAFYYKVAAVGENQILAPADIALIAVRMGGFDDLPVRNPAAAADDTESLASLFAGSSTPNGRAIAPNDMMAGVALNTATTPGAPQNAGSLLVNWDDPDSVPNAAKGGNEAPSAGNFQFTLYSTAFAEFNEVAAGNVEVLIDGTHSKQSTLFTNIANPETSTLTVEGRYGLLTFFLEDGAEAAGKWTYERSLRVPGPFRNEAKDNFVIELRDITNGRLVSHEISVDVDRLPGSNVQLIDEDEGDIPTFNDLASSRAPLNIYRIEALNGGATDTATIFGEALSVTGKYGTLTLQSVRGTYTYEPLNNTDVRELGRDHTLPDSPPETVSEQFRYQVAGMDPFDPFSGFREQDLRESTLRVHLEGRNDSPQLQTNSSLSLSEDSVALIGSGLLNSSDPDRNDTLYYDILTIPAIGTLEVNGSQVVVGNNAFTQQNIDGNKISFVAQGSFDSLPEGALQTVTFDFRLHDNLDALGNTFDGALTRSGTFTVNVTGTNDAPVVANPILDQLFPEEVPLSFQFSANTFSDVDTGDILTYSATVQGGGNLPAWLSFDPATRTFSGTPGKDEDPVTLVVTAADRDPGVSGRLTASDTFFLDIKYANLPPTVVTPLPDQVADINEQFSFQFSPTTFDDPNTGDVLRYSATLVGGSPLPSWLNFNGNTRTFSGTPDGGDIGTLDIVVVAADRGPQNRARLTVTDTFTLTVQSINDAPQVANPIADQNANEDSALNFQFPANSFSDSDVGDVLIYSATLAGGAALPAWLSFNPAQRRFTGTPDNGDVGVLIIEVTAGDRPIGNPERLVITDTFTLTVNNVNDQPTLANPIADQNADDGTPFSFIVPSNTFADVDAGDTFTYSARLAGGGSLPAWLTFNPLTREFSGTPGATDVGTLSVEVFARDQGNDTVSDVFNLTVTNTPPVVLDLNGDGFQFAAFSSLSQPNFDINGDGRLDFASLPSHGDAILAIDLDSDGLITHRAEIAFKDQAAEASTDLEGLRTLYDADHDGFLTSTDSHWSSFGLLSDWNADGILSPGEFLSLNDVGIASIGLTRNSDAYSPADGVHIHGTGTFTMIDGTVGSVADAAITIVENQVAMPEPSAGERLEPMFAITEWPEASYLADDEFAEALDQDHVGLPETNLQIPEFDELLLTGADLNPEVVAEFLKIDGPPATPASAQSQSLNGIADAGLGQEHTSPALEGPDNGHSAQDQQGPVEEPSGVNGAIAPIPDDVLAHHPDAVVAA